MQSLVSLWQEFGFQSKGHGKPLKTIKKAGGKGDSQTGIFIRPFWVLGGKLVGT